MPRKNSTTKKAKKMESLPSATEAPNNHLTDEEIESLARTVCNSDADNLGRTAAFVWLMQEIFENFCDGKSPEGANVALIAARAAYGFSDYGDYTRDCLVSQMRRRRPEGEVAWDSVQEIVESHLENLKHRREVRDEKDR